MGTEIERKYLLQGDGWKTPEVLATAKEIVQFYLTTNEGSRAELLSTASPTVAITSDHYSKLQFIAIGRSASNRRQPGLLIPLGSIAYSKLLNEATEDHLLPIEDKFEARVRVADGEATLTLKGGKGLKRSEFETPLDLTIAHQLLAGRAFVGEPIEKTRYRAELSEGLVAEIDIFEGANAGLRVVEVELPDVDTTVPATSWIGRDVTNSDFGNAKLALNPFGERSNSSFSAF